jgi:hypothetical protein
MHAYTWASWTAVTPRTRSPTLTNSSTQRKSSAIKTRLNSTPRTFFLDHCNFTKTQEHDRRHKITITRSISGETVVTTRLLQARSLLLPGRRRRMAGRQRLLIRPYPRSWNAAAPHAPPRGASISAVRSASRTRRGHRV